MSSTYDTQALWASLKKGHGVWQEKHERATKLSEEHQRVLKEEKDAQDRWHADIVQYARNECTKISGLMCSKLPQELRDCIYQYLCVEDRQILVGPYYHLQTFEFQYSAVGRLSSSTAVRAESPMDDFSEENRVSELPDGRFREEYTDKPPADMLMPNAYIFNPKYMGKIIASEALRYYYSNNVFSVCDVNHGIKMFLDPKEVASYEEDPRHEKQFNQMRHSYSLGVKPLDSVRDLQIRLKFEHFDKLLDRVMPDAGEVESHAFERHYLGKVRTSLRILRSLPETARPLNIEFILMTALYRRPDWQDKMASLFTNILQTIRNLVYEFMHDRINTTVKVIHDDGFISPFPRNLTGLWSLTKEQWQYEADANGPKPEWTANSYITPPHPWHLQVLGGVPISQFQELLRKRWGIEDVFKDTKPKWPIIESDYWPVIIRKNVGWK